MDQIVPGDARVWRAVARTFAALEQSTAKTATTILSERFLVTVTRIGRRATHGRSRSTAVVVTTGKPNYDWRRFIRDCQRAGEPLPVKKIQLLGTW